MNRLETKRRKRLGRKRRIRKRIMGTADCPRLTVFRSNKYTYVQAIDDKAGHTLCSVSNNSKEAKDVKNTTEGVSKLGELIAGKLKEKKIERVVFDRNGYRYHGIVKSVADSARKAGLQF